MIMTRHQLPTDSWTNRRCRRQAMLPLLLLLLLLLYRP
jgi:hypothetical protein